MTRRRLLPRLFLLVVPLLIAGVALVGFLNARADPVVRRATVLLPDWPANAKPVTVALLSDVHIGSMAMDTGRLSRIVGEVNALHPDLIVLAGDFINGHDPVEGRAYAAALTRPLARLSAPLGVIAVLGNHDHSAAPAAVTRGLQAAGITVLANRSVRRGPLVVAGIDDGYTGHAVTGPPLAAARAMGGPLLVVSHGPDVLPLLPADSAPLVLMGHTHCGQVVLPGDLFVSKAIDTGERLFDPRYRCGLVRDPGRLSIVTAGLGTSRLPIRFGAPPDLWLVRLRGSAGRGD
ncbi:metallophosphoesterase [Sphingomonas sp. KR1UV-12]|uniref:Metallophosphoesterase n=1 Tax=Sphingomonas aurea TaxID=3063994 RepID=A0ABT9EJR4_9SPHN|nr:metallophosphoesterase [Sphingomonas sp. KR1UV-12]MDP1027171.1 metallophosphoesterase [Sphingomonas sp. KR1UV-12]